MSNCYYPIFLSVHMEFKVVLSTGNILETIFIASLQDIPSQVSSILLTTSSYQVWTIIILLGTVNVEGEILAYKLSSISRTKRVVFSIPLWHSLGWKLSLYMPMYMPHISCSEGAKILLRKQKLSSLVGSYCIISLRFVFYCERYCLCLFMIFR